MRGEDSAFDRVFPPRVKRVDAGLVDATRQDLELVVQRQTSHRARDVRLSRKYVLHVPQAAPRDKRCDLYAYRLSAYTSRAPVEAAAWIRTAMIGGSNWAQWP